MSKLNSVSRKKMLNVGLIAVALIVILVGAASFYCLSGASATPTTSSLSGTYSSTTGYTIVLYANGTGLFSSHSGTWSIVNETTFEGTYTIMSAPEPILLQSQIMVSSQFKQAMFTLKRRLLLRLPRKPQLYLHRILRPRQCQNSATHRSL